MNLSVCICTFNQAPYLEKAIRSAAEQSFPPFEIIVCDDCSTDNTPVVLARLSKEIPTLKVIRHQKNLGIGKNTDYCLRLATGDFVLRLDSDDYLSKDYSKKLLELMKAYPDAGYAHAAVQEIDQNGNYLKERKLFRKTGFQPSNDALKAAVKGYRVAANIILFRREALSSVNYLAGRPNFGEDYHLTASISAAGFGNVYLEEILSYYRVWVDSGKVRQRRKLDEISGLRRVFDDVLEPAFKERGWNTAIIKRSKSNFACNHSDCLSWDVYNKLEKQELRSELRLLSTSLKAQMISGLYISGLGSSVKFFNNLQNSFKGIAKLLLLKIRGV